MAELDLIDIWNKDKAALQRAELDIERAIGKKSTNILARIRFILRIEFWLNNAITPALGILYFILFGPFWGILTVGIFLVYFLYYLFLIRSIEKYDYSGNVKENLMQIYHYLKFYLLHYKVVIWLSFVALPIISFFYGVYIGHSGEKPAFVFEQVLEIEIEPSSAVWSAAIFFAILVTIAIVLHYLVSLLYEKKIKALKQLIYDFN